MAGILGAVGKAAGGFISNTLARLTGAGLTKGAEGALSRSGEARWSSRTESTDWRVKLTLAPESPLRTLFFDNNKIFEPLRETGGIVFPLTPSVILQHQASYNPLQMAHSNQPHYAYQHSEVASFTCIGEFPVQNYEDARHWVASLHFLRSVTKMFFGGSENPGEFKGNPPPILQFNGYGNYVFKNVPVVVTNFSVELTQGVDYIGTAQGLSASAQDIDEGITNYGSESSNFPESWAPSLSMFNLQLQPVYSRDTMKNFSMRQFVNGSLSPNSEGIGLI